MLNKTLVVLPISDSGCGDILITSNVTALVVEFEYRHEGRDFIGGLRFESAACFRFSGERYSEGFLGDAYDTLIEVCESEWLNKVFGGLDEHDSAASESMHHYAVFFSNNGYLEVVSENVKQVVAREGTLVGEENA